MAFNRWNYRNQRGWGSMSQDVLIEDQHFGKFLNRNVRDLQGAFAEFYRRDAQLIITMIPPKRRQLRLHSGSRSDLTGFSDWCVWERLFPADSSSTFPRQRRVRSRGG